jgi:hypothetical protein
MRFNLKMNSGLLLIVGLSLNACDKGSDTDLVDTQKTARPAKLLTVQAYAPIPEYWMPQKKLNWHSGLAANWLNYQVSLVCR